MNRILVVDDEPDINMLLMLILEDNGYKVDVYHDPMLALSNFKPSFYDLVILDIIMPTMNGLVFYQRIRELDTGFKACFLTMDSKPIRNIDLLEKIKKILGNSSDNRILPKNQR
jgi:DNA-binding response OmpR family regulator